MTRNPIYRLLAFGAVLAVIGGTAACSDTYRARTERMLTDKPASITCYHYGQTIYSGRSKGKVEADENGAISFVDATNNKLTAVEGECVTVYDR